MKKNENFISVTHSTISYDVLQISNMIGTLTEDEKFYFQFYEWEKQPFDQELLKNWVVITYNLGKCIEENFTFNDYTSKRQNIFMLAFKTYQDTIKPPTLIYDKLEKQDNIARRKFKRIAQDIIKEKQIENKQVNELIKLVNEFITTISSHEKYYDTFDYRPLFSIIMLAHDIYLTIKEKKPSPDVNCVFSEMLHNEKDTLQLNFYNINSLIYLALKMYTTSSQSNFIFCEVCGKMAIGNKGKHTCSEVCRKKRNGSYKS